MMLNFSYRCWQGVFCFIWLCLSCAGVVFADAEGATDTPATSPATQPAEDTIPAQKTSGGLVQMLPNVQVDITSKTIDLKAKVVQREANWLELLACSPNTREHEAILTIEARPSHIHLALTAIGLKHGSPMKVRRLDDGQLETKPATGPGVAVTIMYTRDGEKVEVPANEWIINREINKTLDSNKWLFTGSYVHEFNGQTFFMADVEGTILSLVNFGDDLLTVPSKTTNYTDQEQLGCNTEVIPPLGTEVVVRLKPWVENQEGENKDEVVKDEIENNGAKDMPKEQ